jgi:hypothetical protein
MEKLDISIEKYTEICQACHASCLGRVAPLSA